MNTAINHAGLRPRKNVSSFHGKTIMPWKLTLYFPPPVNVADRLLLDSFEIFICPRTSIYSFIAQGTKDEERFAVDSLPRKFILRFDTFRVVAKNVVRM